MSEVPEEIYRVICKCGLEVSQGFTQIVGVEKNIVRQDKVKSLQCLNKAKSELADVSTACGVDHTVPSEVLDEVMEDVSHGKWDDAGEKMRKFRATLIDQFKLCV